MTIHYAILSSLGCLKFYIKRVKGKLAASNENLAKAKKKMYGKNPEGRHSVLFPRAYSVDSHEKETLFQNLRDQLIQLGLVLTVGSANSSYPVWVGSL